MTESLYPKHASGLVPEISEPWRTDPPPTSGVVETAGFPSVRDTAFFGIVRLFVAPGRVDAGVYTIPNGTRWRPV